MRQFRATVVIPTYQRADLLRRTLASLAEQRPGGADFEVVVSDDGSSDGTTAVVDSFRDRLHLQYHYQEDLGFRLSAARNAGARLSRSPLLILLDTGTLAGPDFVDAHVARHARADHASAVIGYTYGYQPIWGAPPEFDRILTSLTPAAVVRRYGGKSWMRDWRHEEFVRLPINRRAAPWILYMAMNCSISTADYWRIGGFEERFVTWGVEDLEFSFRAHRHGLRFVVATDCWAIECPHERAVLDNLSTAKDNAGLFLDLHPCPEIEMASTVLCNAEIWAIERASEQLRSWTAESASLDVFPELARLRRPIGGRTAVIGCGGHVPEFCRDAVLVDFDSDQLHRVAAAGATRTQHGLGTRLPIGDGALDDVFITSRLKGLWPQWGELILAEAHRVASTVTSL